jgi:Divergent InlB B-repeat domain
MNLTNEKTNDSNNFYAGFLTPGKTVLRTALSIVLLALCIIFAPTASQAQTATVYGQLGNFDVINHTGHDGHGFEIEMEGIQTKDISYSFSAQRYGAATITPTATGVLVRWASAYNNGAFTQTTLAHEPNTPFAGSCYQWGANYNSSACEHFGVSLTAAPTHTTYRWLIEDANNAGTLIGFDPPIAIVTPVYTITPPVRVAEAPVLVAEFEAPEAAESPEVYGDAQWVKVFKTQLKREANLDELVSDNAVVPQDAAHVEVQWEIVQTEPVSNSNSNGNRQHRNNQETLNFDTRSVLRRYETYSYTGAYDPVTHKALCADLLCNAPGDGELGEYIGAQMTAANVSVPSVSVAKTGNGLVSSADKFISCGGKCGAGYNQGAVVTLTATAASGNLFLGWGGACGGTVITCTVTANDAVNVTANFAPAFNVSAKTSGGKGAVSGPAAGIDCGRTCTGRAAQGTAVAFTATPEAGFRFLNWSGACSGTARTCSVSITRDTAVQANFTK